MAVGQKEAYLARWTNKKINVNQIKFQCLWRLVSQVNWRLVSAPFTGQLQVVKV